MNFDQTSDLELVKQTGNQIIFRIGSPNDDYSTEFSSEFLSLGKINQDLKEKARKLATKKFPNLKLATIVILAGAVVLTSFPLHKASAHEIDYNMSYLYFGNTSSYIKQIDKTEGNLNHVSPSYFDLNPDGTLKITQQFDPYFVSEMHKRGIKVIPFLSNHWDRNSGRAALQNREQLAQQLADFIMKNNLDGVQVDIENVTEIDRENYTDFVRLLREKLPKDKELSVAVAANPNGWTKGWHGSYDYRALQQYADYLMVMAYDESYTGSPEGPVASFGWVERSIKYALAQGVPPEKVVLGIPFYGRYWKEGEATGGNGISNQRVDELLAKYGGKVTFDEATQSPKATITIKAGDPVTVIAGQTFGPGTYHIWYENNESIQAKLRLLHKYNLKGTGSWSLGQENASIWQHYRSWLSHDGEITVEPSIPEQPKEQTGIVEPAEQKSYTVKPGDSLWGVANKFHLTVNQLKQYNQLQADVIYVGQVLSLIPKVQAAPVVISKPIANTPGAITAPAKSTTPPKTSTSKVVPKTSTAKPSSSLVGKYMVGKATKTYMRSGASSKNKVVKTLKTTDSLKVLQEYTDKSKVKWLKVQTGKTTGWVLSSQVKQKPATTVKTSTTTAKKYTTLKYGMRGSSVTTLQTKLKKLGLYKTRVDGSYGPGTRTAVIAFQKKYKLKADGIAGSSTLAKLDTVVK